MIHYVLTALRGEIYITWEDCVKNAINSLSDSFVRNKILLFFILLHSRLIL